MELSDVGEHVFAAECIIMSRMNKVNKDLLLIRLHFVVQAGLSTLFQDAGTVWSVMVGQAYDV